LDLSTRITIEAMQEYNELHARIHASIQTIEALQGILEARQGHKTACKQAKNQAKKAKKKAKKQPKELPYDCWSSESCEDKFDSPNDLTWTAPVSIQSKQHELDDGDKAWLKRNETWLKQDAELWAASRSNTQAASINNTIQQEETHWYNTIGQEDILSDNVGLPPACTTSAHLPHYPVSAVAQPVPISTSPTMDEKATSGLTCGFWDQESEYAELLNMQKLHPGEPWVAELQEKWLLEKRRSQPVLNSSPETSSPTAHSVPSAPGHYQASPLLISPKDIAPRKFIMLPKHLNISITWSETEQLWIEVLEEPLDIAPNKCQALPPAQSVHPTAQPIPPISTFQEANDLANEPDFWLDDISPVMDEMTTPNLPSGYDYVKLLKMQELFPKESREHKANAEPLEPYVLSQGLTLSPPPQSTSSSSSGTISVPSSSAPTYSQCQRSSSL
jgi:hypothetical protein